MKPATPGFAITGHKGFHITFENGWTISVQFGPGNYCKNYPMKGIRDWDAPAKSDSWTSPDAEIAAWGRGGDMASFGHDSVKGRVSPDEVAAYIAKIAAFPKDSTAESLGEPLKEEVEA